MEDVPVQVAVSNGTNDGVLLGLGDVHLPTEWEPVSENLSWPPSG